MVLVATCCLLKLLIFREIVKADRTRALSGVTLFHPHFLRNTCYLFWLQTFRDLSISFFQFTDLFVTHLVYIGSVRVCIGFALFDGSLQESLLLSLSAACSKHTVHHDLHHNVSLPLPMLLLLQLHC